LAGVPDPVTPASVAEWEMAELNPAKDLKKKEGSMRVTIELRNVTIRVQFTMT
jgi:hypothetical protein